MNEIEFELLASLARGNRLYEYPSISSRWGCFLSIRRTGEHHNVDAHMVHRLINDGFLLREPFAPFSESTYSWIVLSPQGRNALAEVTNVTPFTPERVEHQAPLTDVLGRRGIMIADTWGHERYP